METKTVGDGETRQARVRLTDDENRGLKALAAVEGCSKEEYLGRLIRREMKAAGIRLRGAKSA